MFGLGVPEFIIIVVFTGAVAFVAVAVTRSLLRNVEARDKAHRLRDRRDDRD